MRAAAGGHLGGIPGDPMRTEAARIQVESGRIPSAARPVVSKHAFQNARMAARLLDGFELETSRRERRCCLDDGTSKRLESVFTTRAVDGLLRVVDARLWGLDQFGGRCRRKRFHAGAPWRDDRASYAGNDGTDASKRFRALAGRYADAQRNR